MSKHYNILGWNPMNTENVSTLASCYIKPDLKLLELFNRAPLNNVLLQISGTNSVYDNKKIFGVIDKSSDVPNCRQNFFNCTGLYVITMDSTWMGYPKKLGTIEFFGGVVDKIINDVLPLHSQMGTNPKKSQFGKNIEENFLQTNDTKSDRFSNTFLIILVMVLILLSIFLYFQFLK